MVKGDSQLQSSIQGFSKIEKVEHIINNSSAIT